MWQQIIIACWPYLTAIMVCILVLRVLVWASGARLKLTHFSRLHQDEVGGVQTLSFVLTVPLFLFVIMFIVQLSQITIAQVVVEYASYAAARSAIVWIPANVSLEEEENRIGLAPMQYLGTEYGDGNEFVGDSDPWQVEEGSSIQGRDVYQVVPGSSKFERIRFAAAMACMPISPSREVVPPGDAGETEAVNALLKAYHDAAPSSVENSRIPSRIQNKLAYALANTEIEIKIRHRHAWPTVPLWYIFPQTLEPAFQYNEIDWQDTITVELTHHFALLPGPGRLLARRADAPPGTSPEASRGQGVPPDSVAAMINKNGSVYVYSLSSRTRLGNEGLVPSRRYFRQAPTFF